MVMDLRTVDVDEYVVAEIWANNAYTPSWYLLKYNHRDRVERMRSGIAATDVRSILIIKRPKP
jgi:hypothetical protein